MARMSDEKVAEVLRGTSWGRTFELLKLVPSDLTNEAAQELLRLLAEAKGLLDQIYMIAHVGDQDIPYPLLKDMFRWFQRLQGDAE